MANLELLWSSFLFAWCIEHAQETSRERIWPPGLCYIATDILKPCWQVRRMTWT